MQRDSIRENLSKEDLIVTIQMELDAAIGEDTCIVLVEGQDDIMFVESFFADNVVCYESFSGKEGLTELLADSKMQRKDIIAIRDKDYMDMEQLPFRMFVYDGCCMETMLLECNEVAESFYRIYYGGNSAKETYINDMMRELAPYSILRQKNEKNNWRIDFQKVGFGNLVDMHGKLDMNALFSRLRLDEEELEDCRRLAEQVPREQLKDITNGHDLCLMMGLFPKKGRKKLGEEGARQVLLSSYRKSDFQKTQLYDSIKEYQHTHDLKYVDE